MQRQITTKTELTDLIAELASEDTAQWENSKLTTFLEALGAWLEDSDGYYKNAGLALDPDSATWQLLGDALQAAKVYE